MVRVSKERLKAQKKKRERIIFNWLIIFACLVIVGSLYFWVYDEPLELETITKCLEQKEAKMYCSDNIESCLEQKRVFGYFFDRINYVNCDFKVKECESENINKFPTWEINGEKANEILSLKDFQIICSN